MSNYYFFVIIILTFILILVDYSNTSRRFLLRSRRVMYLKSKIMLVQTVNLLRSNRISMFYSTIDPIPSLDIYCRHN